MEYERLSKVFYKKGNEAYQEEIKKRRENYGSFDTGLKIRGFRKGKKMPESYGLFYVNVPSLMILNNRVLLNSSNITSLIARLPAFVVEPYFHKLIVNEAQSNNAVEGVRSTKNELKEALTDVLQSEAKRRRFNGLMKTYLFIDTIKPFREARDFRSLYDELVSGEIESGDEPDGVLFRNGYVEVNDGTKTTHIGLLSEVEIMEGLNSLIQFLEDDRQPELYRFMAAHYYYEYIHPFYDGNGRTGRLLVGSYVSKYLEKYSAVVFSYMVNKNKSTYYKALETIPDPLNQGEITFYLMDMLQLLAQGQEEVIDDLEMNAAKMERIEAFFQSGGGPEKKEEAELLRLMTYMHVFVEEDEPHTLKSLMNLSGHSRYKVEQAASRLEAEGAVHLTNHRPKSYRVSETWLNQVFESEKTDINHV
ncbi:Fic family protein [Alkalicoccus urumqiensis]|uniref:Fic family protein n=1 Tax=Alkalicoccus urumqiensis TaxID=1548213 RepID=A0A2P6MJG6_ALKUR|nr:Fic family protein [Alkalicoccus urumqiensis]PRO66405.1 Fic family protein [Alkalicoccus urumqiensis]